MRLAKATIRKSLSQITGLKAGAIEETERRKKIFIINSAQAICSRGACLHALVAESSIQTSLQHATMKNYC